MRVDLDEYNSIAVKRDQIRRRLFEHDVVWQLEEAVNQHQLIHVQWPVV